MAKDEIPKAPLISGHPIEFWFARGFVKFYFEEYRTGKEHRAWLRWLRAIHEHLGTDCGEERMREVLLLAGCKESK